MAQILLRFPHGLGDVVQFSVVLAHLARHRPSWQVDVVCGIGKHTALLGQCRSVYHKTQIRPPDSAYQSSVELGWSENYCRYPDRPNSKITNCLAEVFGLGWDRDLARYRIIPSAAAAKRCGAYLDNIDAVRGEGGRYNVVVIHYEGNTSPWKKNLSHAQVEHLVTLALDCGKVPVILDWDKRSPLVDQKRVFSPRCGEGDIWGNIGTGDAVTIHALIGICEAFVGIDSGPGKVASATDTPSLICWRKHHPIQFHDPAANTTHLVPIDHHRMTPCLPEDPRIAEFFIANYDYLCYEGGDVGLPVEAVKWLATVLDAGQSARHKAVSRTRVMRNLSTTVFGEAYYQQHKDAGLDYLECGDWQMQYGRWLAGSLGWKGKRVLDVGCACGSIVRGMGEAGIVTNGVELNEYMVRLARSKWPDMEPILFTADAINLHMFANESWDGIHCAQVAEHWRPCLVSHILDELWRVTAPGGLFFCCLDTAELFDRQGRELEKEDATHYCIRPMAWWKEKLRESGWKDVTADVDMQLRSHADSMIAMYDWDWFVAQKGKKPLAGGIEEGGDDRGDGQGEGVATAEAGGVP